MAHPPRKRGFGLDLWAMGRKAPMYWGYTPGQVIRLPELVAAAAAAVAAICSGLTCASALVAMRHWQGS